MKRIYYILAVAVIFTTILSCKKNGVQVIASPVSGAQVKFFNFAISGPVVNFYVNDTKATASGSTTGAESGTTGVAYGAVYPSINSYAVIKPGTYDIKAVRPSTATADPNLVIATINSALADGKRYSLYTSGLYNTVAKTSDVFIINDDLPAIDTSTAYVRLVNASFNSPTVNLSMRNTFTLVETVVASNVSYKSGSVFAKIPGGVYDLILRDVASPGTQLVVRTAVGVSRSYTYTFTLRGDITLPYTGTAANRPVIDNTPNR